jgi:hypothetical protein
MNHCVSFCLLFFANTRWIKTVIHSWICLRSSTSLTPLSKPRLLKWLRNTFPC